MYKKIKFEKTTRSSKIARTFFKKLEILFFGPKKDLSF